MLLGLHLTTYDYPTRWMVGFDHGRQATERLRPFQPAPTEVMSSNWVFYDYNSPWRDKYVHIPVYIDSVPTLVDDMRRRGVALSSSSTATPAGPSGRACCRCSIWSSPRPACAPVGPAIYSREWPPNEIVVYRLDE